MPYLVLSSLLLSLREQCTFGLGVGTVTSFTVTIPKLWPQPLELSANDPDWSTMGNTV